MEAQSNLFFELSNDDYSALKSWLLEQYLSLKYEKIEISLELRRILTKIEMLRERNDEHLTYMIVRARGAYVFNCSRKNR